MQTDKFDGISMPRVARIGEQIWDDLSVVEGELGRIGRIWEDGFLTTHENGRVLYFFQTRCLHVPFGICVEGPMKEWISRTGSKKGDPLIMERGKVFFPLHPDWVVVLAPAEVINLEVEKPQSAISLCQITGVIDAITRYTSSLEEVVNESGRWPGGCDLPGTCAQQSIEQLVRSAIAGDRSGLFAVFRDWIGRGSGLTPSGDDLLVGFLFGWRAFCETPLFEDLSQREVKEFSYMVRSRTTSISAELIRFAMRGCFSEILCDLLAELRMPGGSRDLPQRLGSLLQWGGSSGRSTLDGLMLSLKVLLLSGGRAIQFHPEVGYRP